LFNTVGPRQTGQYGMVVPNFIKAALKNEPIPVHGNGAQSRCFGHVLDVVEALVKLLETPAAFGQVVNIGNDQETSIKALAEKAVAMTGSSSQIKYISYDEAYGEGFEDMQRRVPCLDKARRLVNYQPTRTMDDIINDVMEQFRQELKIEAEKSAKAV
jgi:UDP-glucose 4-epimerase